MSENIKRCRICVLSESFPGISFDKEGICSYCNSFHEDRNSSASLAKCKMQLDELIRKNKAASRDYDAVIAYSGGKDSTYLLKLLVEKYALNPLAVTFDNGFLSSRTWVNISNVINYLNVDWVNYRLKPRLMNRIITTCMDKEIYPEYLTKYGSPICISCIRLIYNFAIRLAIEKRINLIFIGNSPGQMLCSDNEIIYRDNKIPFQLRRNLYKPLADEIGEDIYRYFMIDKDEYKDKCFPYIVNPYPVIGYDEKMIYSEISMMGWKKPNDVDPTSTNCVLNLLGIVEHYKKYNFHPYEYEISLLVRKRIISRDDALKRVEINPDTLSKEAEDIARKIRLAGCAGFAV